MPAANVNPEIDLNSYVLKENEVIMYCPVNNKSTGMYGGLTRKLGYITLRKDDRERFYSYGFNKEKTSLFYCHMKTPLPNVLQLLKSICRCYSMKIKIRRSFRICFLLAINS